MNIRPSPKAAPRGSVLMITVVATAVMGIMLMAYLSLTNAQTTAISRSQAWNAAIPVLEYGIEEALAHLNQNGTTNLDRDGWYESGSHYYKWRQVSNSWVFVNISNGSSPVIYAYGYTRVPLQRYQYITPASCGWKPCGWACSARASSRRARSPSTATATLTAMTPATRTSAPVAAMTPPSAAPTPAWPATPG